MAKVTLNIVKSWFVTGAKPNQNQFSDTWDSFWHKDENIPIAKIDGINSVFNAINEVSANVRFVGVGQLTIYKHPSNNLPANVNIVETNDVGVGFFADGIFMPFGKYLGGKIQDVNNWDTSPMWQITE